MRTRSIFSMLLATLLSACLPSTVQLTCADIAAARCATCDECAGALDQDAVSSDERIGSQELCDARYTSTAECEADLEIQCIDAASGRQEVNAELDACLEELQTQDTAQVCDELYTSWALDRPRASGACARFL